MKHEADEHKYRARGRCFLQLRREISHGPRHDRFLRPVGRGDSNRWSVWSEAGGKGTRRQLAKGVFGHVDDGGRRRIGEAGPIDIVRQTAILGVAGDVLQSPRVMSLRQRDLQLRRRALRGGNAGHDLDGLSLIHI